jgi:hypothetical protein
MIELCIFRIFLTLIFGVDSVAPEAFDVIETATCWYFKRENGRSHSECNKSGACA